MGYKIDPMEFCAILDRFRDICSIRAILSSNFDRLAFSIGTFSRPTFLLIAPSSRNAIVFVRVLYPIARGYALLSNPSSD